MPIRDAYLQLLVRSWSDNEFNDRIDADPRGAAAEAGIDIPAHVPVTVVRHDAPAETTGDEHDVVVDEQAKRIERGIADGAVELHVPGTPSVDGAELSVEELESTSAGACCSCCCGW